MCPTRWAFRAQSLTTGLNNYAEILTALRIVGGENSREEHNSEAMGLEEQFGKSRMYWGHVVAKSVFEPADRLTRSLQAPDMTVSGCIEAVKMTHNYRLSLRDKETFRSVMEQTEAAMKRFDLEPLSNPRIRRWPTRIDDGSPSVELSVVDYHRQQYYMVSSLVLICSLLCTYYIVYLMLFVYCLTTHLRTAPILVPKIAYHHHHHLKSNFCSNQYMG